MGDADKALLLSLIRAVENLVIDKIALTKFSEMNAKQATLRDIYLSTARSDLAIGGITHARFQSICDQVEHAPDLSKGLQLLLSALQ